MPSLTGRRINRTDAASIKQQSHFALGRLFCCAALSLSACASTPVTTPINPAAGPTSGPSSEMVTSLQEEQLLGAPPVGWVQIGGTVTRTLKMAEFVPVRAREPATAGQGAATQSSEALEAEGGWSEKITFERLLGTPVADPLEFLDELRKDTLAACSGGAFHPIASGFENGYPSAVALIVCPRQAVSNLGQLTMIKVIQGNAAFYTITRSIRTPPFPPDKDGMPIEPPVEKETIGGFSVYLKAITVCDPTRKEHPCPVIPTSN